MSAYQLAALSGADVVIHSASKYISGHSDCILGVIVCKQEFYEEIRITSMRLGEKPGSEDIFLALRGLKTLKLRLDKHFQNASKVASWFSGLKMVKRILFPAWPEHPGHCIWARDFTGANGLLSVEFHPERENEIKSNLNKLNLFGIGYGWGGYESLVMPVSPVHLAIQNVKGGEQRPTLLRFHIGLEYVDDLIEDLELVFGV